MHTADMCVRLLQRVLRDYRKVERRLLARVAERDAALEAAASERLNGSLLGRAQVRNPCMSLRQSQPPLLCRASVCCAASSCRTHIQALA